MAEKVKNQSSDEHLFRQQMEDVVPLKATPRSDSKPPRTQRSKTAQHTDPVSATSIQAQPVDEKSHIDSEDGSSHRKNGVQKRIMQKLKRGQYPVSDQLDLHHMSLETGHKTLLEFIAGSQGSNPECVRIIHGKGLRSGHGPRLKLMTWQLLREHPQVLAFTTCKPADGGSGAVDVLLKSR